MADQETRTWKDVPEGGIVEPGTSEPYNTGSWRSYRPIWHEDKCIHCLQCWAYCPDCAIKAENQKFGGFDYYHCKGCGICAQICPVKGEKAITMVLETEAAKAEK